MSHALCTFCSQPATRTVFVSRTIVTHHGSAGFETAPCCDDPACLAKARRCYERTEPVPCDTCRQRHASLLQKLTGRSPCPQSIR